MLRFTSLLSGIATKSTRISNIKITSPLLPLSLTTIPRFFFSTSNQVLDMIKQERYEKNLDRICI